MPLFLLMYLHLLLFQFQFLLQFLHLLQFQFLFAQHDLEPDTRTVQV